MSNPAMTPSDPVQAAYERGRRVGLATAALALSVVSFLNLLGVEKSLLAIVLATLALRGAGSIGTAVLRSRIALVLASIHAVSIIAVVIIFREELTQFGRQLVELLHTLS